MASRRISSSIWTSCNARAGPSTLPVKGSAGPCRLGVRQFTSSIAGLSGHNRWSKIKHKKGAADAQRAVLHSRLNNDIHTALKPPNSMDPAFNPKLAAAMAKAREGGVTKATIEGVFAKVRSVLDGTGQNITLEALGPGGKEAFMIQCITDNANRTRQAISKVLVKYHYRLAPVAFLFEKKGIITITPPPSPSKGFDDLFELAVEGGAEDVREVEGEEGVEWEIYTQPSDLGSLTSLLSAPPNSIDFPIRSSEMGYVPNDPLDITTDDTGMSEDKAETIFRTVADLEIEPDVVKVWTNLA